MCESERERVCVCVRASVCVCARQKPGQSIGVVQG